jgi:hypothetical protein
VPIVVPVYRFVVAAVPLPVLPLCGGPSATERCADAIV